MKNIIFGAVVFCLSISHCFAASGLGPAIVHDSHPNQCYNKDEKTYYKAGDSWQLEGCGQAMCTMMNLTGNPQLMVSYESCGTMEVGKPCYLTADTSMNYPECCPQVACPEDSEEENGQTNSEGQVEDDESSRQDVHFGHKGQQYDDFLYQDQDQEQIYPESYQSLDFDDKNTRQLSPRFRYVVTNKDSDYNDQYQQPLDYQYQWF